MDDAKRQVSNADPREIPLMIIPKNFITCSGGSAGDFTNIYDSSATNKDTYISSPSHSYLTFQF